MLILQDGTKLDNITSFLVKKGKGWTRVGLGDNQFFHVTPTGKRIELWEGKKEYLTSLTGFYRVKYWNMCQVISFYGI